mgnify:CR=1 FL=1
MYPSITSGVNFWREVVVMYRRFFEKLRSPFFDYFCGSYKSIIHDCHFFLEMGGGGSLPSLNIDHSRAMSVSKHMQSG